MWETDWKSVETSKYRQGGQGTVIKVISLTTQAVVGGLKQLHPEHLNSTERRFRMQQEANALVALAGNGVPHLLASNSERWNDKGTPLFLVMEWIEGPTLTEARNRQVPSLDDALDATRAILRPSKHATK